MDQDAMDALLDQVTTEGPVLIVTSDGKRIVVVPTGHPAVQGSGLDQDEGPPPRELDQGVAERIADSADG